jgi:hypothetical protein
LGERREKEIGKKRGKKRGHERKNERGKRSERGEKDLRKGAAKPYRDLWNTIEMRKQ